jgi:uncharacterized protein (DUF433 family)
MNDVNRAVEYQYLEQRLCHRCRPLYIKGTPLRAETLYRETVGEEARTPEEVARDFDVPVEAVREAIEYCIKNAAQLRQWREEELVRIKEFEKKYPPLLPPDYHPES